MVQLKMAGRSVEEEEVSYALKASDWVRGKLGFEPDVWQAGVLDSVSNRVIINCSRQSGKSTTTAALAAHTAVYLERSLVLLVNPSKRQSGELIEKIREFLKVGGVEMVDDYKFNITLGNGSRVVALPSGAGTIRGFSGVRLLILDEAAWIMDSLYNAVSPMLAVSGGKMVLLSTPYGKRGFFYREWMREGKGWHRVKVTAEDCPRIPKWFLEEERASKGELSFQSEYMCEFVDNVTQLISSDLIRAALADDMDAMDFNVVGGEYYEAMVRGEIEVMTF